MKSDYDLINNLRYLATADCVIGLVSPKTVVLEASQRLAQLLAWQKADKGLTFGDAIQALKQGHRVMRSGWNGKGMYLWMLPAAVVPVEWIKEPHLKEIAKAKGGSVECLASIRMRTATGDVLTGWLASQSDMFAEDWEIIGEVQG